MNAPAPAILVERSDNKKTGAVAVTWASIGATCPPSCASLRSGACYAQGYPSAHTVKRLDAAAAGLSDLDVARVEAAAIRAAFGGGPVPRDPSGRRLPLRIHVAGDCRTPEAAELLADAAADWIARGGGPAWTYTHAWHDVPRSAWGPISVLASLDDAADVDAAAAQGYRWTAVVVPSHGIDRAVRTHDGRTILPCPEQTRGTPCVDCRACFRADDGRTTILFAAHGQNRKHHPSLQVIQ
jgi:hypothetical protein